MREKYTHGHAPTIVADHARRTAANSAGFVLDRLRAEHELLDLGCGPGSITLDLAGIVTRVIGIDAAPEAIDRATADASRRGVTNVEFRVGDVYTLDFDDESFDVVYAHQLLQHLGDPVAALAEAYRVLRPGGIIAVRDADYGTMVHSPHQPLIDRWLDLYHIIARHNGGEPDAGRYLGSWVTAAGFIDVDVTTSTWTYATPDAVAGWSDLWTSRLRTARFGRSLIEEGFADHDEVEATAAAFEDWARAPQPFFAFLHGEVVARKAP